MLKSSPCFAQHLSVVEGHESKQPKEVHNHHYSKTRQETEDLINVKGSDIVDEDNAYDAALLQVIHALGEALARLRFTE
eukprot:c35446_g1_i1 orf=64-300(+)